MLEETKFHKAARCLEKDRGQIGLLRLRYIVKQYFGIMDELIITNWLNYMLMAKLIKEVSTGQFEIL